MRIYSARQSVLTDRFKFTYTPMAAPVFEFVPDDSIILIGTPFVPYVISLSSI